MLLGNFWINSSSLKRLWWMYPRRRFLWAFLIWVLILLSKKRLSKLISTYYPQCKLKLVFKCNNRLRNCFVFKDRIPFNVRSHLLYRFSCSSCNSAYVGKSKRHYLVRISEHLGISLRTGSKFTFNPNNKNNSAVLAHIKTKCKYHNSQ